VRRVGCDRMRAGAWATPPGERGGRAGRCARGKSPPEPFPARVVRPSSLYWKDAVVATLPASAPRHHLEIMPGTRHSLLISDPLAGGRAGVRGASGCGRSALAAVVVLIFLVAPAALASGHEAGGACRGSCSARGCLCNHRSGHSNDCPCCTATRARTKRPGVSVPSCHCGRDGEPATASPPQGERVLAKVPPLSQPRAVRTVSSGRQFSGAEVAADPPDPVPRP
jgi:hypothetical protein